MKNLIKRKALQLSWIEEASPALAKQLSKTGLLLHIADVHRALYVLYRSIFVVVKNWKQPKWPSVGEWMNKLLYICTMKCYAIRTKTN